MPKGRTRPERTLPVFHRLVRVAHLCASTKAHMVPKGPPNRFARTLSPAQVCSLRPQHRRPTSHTRGRARPAYQVARPLVGSPNPVREDPPIAQAGPSPPSAGCSTELRGRRPPNIEDPPIVAGGLSWLSPQKRTTTHTHLRPTRFAVSKVRRAKPGGTYPHSVATARGRERAGVTQLVEYPFCNRVVEGSNPFAGTGDVA